MAYRKPAFYRMLLCLLGLGLGGCATTGNMPLAQAGLNVPTKIMVIQVPMAADRERLQSVLAPSIQRKLSVSEEPIAHGMRRAQEFVSAALTQALSKQPALVLVNPPPDKQPLVGTIQGYPFGTELSQAEADRIRTNTGADTLLRFGITDYGLTPTSWRKSYITFEVTTTLALAAVIAYSKIPAAKAAAGAYLAQETVEETAEAYAGFWALDVISRPVRIEAELIRLNPVATIWKTSDTGLSEFKWSRLTRTIEPAERNGQLDRATDAAVTDIVSELANALGTIKPISVQH